MGPTAEDRDGASTAAAHRVFGTIYDIGDASGPIVAGLLVMSWGYRPMLATIAIVALIVAPVPYVLLRSGEARR